MRLSVLFILCAACGGVYFDHTGGKHAEIVTLLKPEPVHHPWELFTPTSSQPKPSQTARR